MEIFFFWKIPIFHNVSSDAFEMNLPPNHTEPTQLSGLWIVSSVYDLFFYCMEVKGRELFILYI